MDLNKLVLDPCCGSRMFYFDKKDSRVLFGDIREGSFSFVDSRGSCHSFDVSPDYLGSVTKLPFSDGSFKMVVFDPPHLVCSSSSRIGRAYGSLPLDWKSFFRDSFAECWRVLDPSFGVLIFKWADDRFSCNDVLSCTDLKPLFGSKVKRRSNLFWLVFVKSSSSFGGSL